MSADYPWWSCRFWNGMDAPTWFGLLARHRFDVSWRRFHIVFGASYFSLLNSLLNGVQQLLYARAIDRQADPAPLFIIGHWRSGTTFLHELLACDPLLVSPTTYECFVPQHFLVSRRLGMKLEYLVPKIRPMDPMEVDWSSAQEDEFALMSMGLGSSYEAVAFPSALREAFAGIGDSSRSADERAAWQRHYRGFLKSVLYGRSQAPRAARVVSKSPPHTARLAWLAEMFPDAKFIHLVRHPEDVFPSSVNLWRSLIETQSCQGPESNPPDEELAAFVLDLLPALYSEFFEAAERLPPQRFCEIRYEDLIAAPQSVLEHTYRQLVLPGWDNAQSSISDYLNDAQSWKAATHAVSPFNQKEIWRRWGFLYERYGYQPRGFS